MKINKKLLLKNSTLIIIAFGVIIVAAIVVLSGGLANFNLAKIFKSHPSSQEIAQKTIIYINEQLLKGKSTASLMRVKEESGLIKLQIKLGNEELHSYVTNDGKLFLPQAYNLDDKVSVSASK